MFAVLTCILFLFGAPDAGATTVYKVDKFSVEAEAKNAVSAKKKAMGQAERGAFELLMRRLVPVTSYANLPKIPHSEIATMIDGLSVRSERNSRTRYLATLDFSFSSEAVQAVMKANNLRFVDEPAEMIEVIPLFIKADGQLDTGLSPWRKAWLGVDGLNALTPLKIGQVKPSITVEMARALMSGNQESLTNAQQQYGTPRILFAVAEENLETGELFVTLAGNDATGRLMLNRVYRTLSDSQYAMAKSAALSLSILEGRWKTTKVRFGAGADLNALEQEVLITVEFSGFREWQKIRGRLDKIPGVKAMDVGSLSARGAEVTLKYPGGAEGLSRQVATQELTLENVAGAWILRSF